MRSFTTFERILQNNFNHNYVIPKITLALRREHIIFDNPSGKKTVEKLYKYYNSYSNNYPILSFPFYLPNMIENNNAKKNISIESCFAINIENNNVMSQKFTTLSSFNYDKKIDTNVLNGNINTHIIQDNICIKRKLPFVLDIKQYNNLYQYKRMDSISIIDTLNIKCPINFNVVIANDNELNIDEEWDTIREWATKN